MMFACRNLPSVTPSLATTIVLLGLAACSGPDKLQLTLNAAPRVNPDLTGASMPVQVHVYALRSASKFDSTDFFALTDTDKHPLQGDLISSQDMMMRPGQSQTVTLPVGDDLKYVGVAASFQKIDNSVWHASLAMPASGKANALLSGDSVVLTKAD